MSQETIPIVGEPMVYEIPRPDISHLVTEDDTPVDNIFSEKQMRLLAGSLYSGWAGPSDGRPFLSMTNVALYSALHTPALVPEKTGARPIWCLTRKTTLLIIEAKYRNHCGRDARFGTDGVLFFVISTLS